MNRKRELMAELRAAYGEWEQPLSTADEGLGARRVTSKWTLKDLVAHVMAWQQITIARLEAAIAGGEPKLPAWLEGADPAFANEHVHEYNAKIYDMYQAQSWGEVHRAWGDGFAHLIELAETIEEEALLDAGRHPWLGGYALADVLFGTCEHHREHLDALLRALGD